MYTDRNLKKTRDTRVRLNPAVDDLLRRVAEKHGVQPAVYMRYLLEKDLNEKGFEFPRDEAVHHAAAWAVRRLWRDDDAKNE